MNKEKINSEKAMEAAMGSLAQVKALIAALNYSISDERQAMPEATKDMCIGLLSVAREKIDHAYTLLDEAIIAAQV